MLFKDFVDAIVFFFFYLELQTLSAVVYIFALPRWSLDTHKSWQWLDESVYGSGPKYLWLHNPWSDTVTFLSDSDVV